MIISDGGGFNLLWVIDPFVILLKAMTSKMQIHTTFDSFMAFMYP